MGCGNDERQARDLSRVVVVGLASCFGCQLQITNVEEHLTDVLGQIDLRYWQLASSEPMPEEFDVAVIEGAVTTEESEATVRKLRERAKCVIALGACAATAGIPGHGFHRRAAARAVRLEQVRPYGHHVRAVQAQRHRLLLRPGPAVPGPGDGGRLRREVREPRAGVQRLPRAFPRRQP